MNVTLRNLAALFSATMTLALTGCGTYISPVPSAEQAAIALQGSVHGGQQPVVGATINFYTASTSGYGTAGTSLLKVPVVTGPSGTFSITGDYTCPSGALVYLVATGGNPGTTALQSNSGLAMMAGLGPCSSLSSSTKIEVNEVTTVASVWALAPFMTSTTAVGTSPGNVLGLANAFAAINKVVNVATGATPGTALPAGASLPTANINTIADILAACVDSVNQSGGSVSSNCSTLFADTAVGSSTPTDTIQAALSMAHNPTLNLVPLTNLVSSIGAPYQPTLGSTVPSSWQIAINYVGGGLSTPKALAIDTSGNVWIANSANSVTELSNTGAPISGASGFTAGPVSSPTAITLDSNNTAWVTNSGNNTLTHLSASGNTGTSISGGGLNNPSSIAIDQNGNVWVGNAGNSSLSEFTSAGAALSSTSGNTGGGLNRPVAIAIE